MDKIGIKILENIDYEQFENFQYLLDYDFEHEDMISAIEEQKIIELDIEEDEDREEDLEALKELLLKLDNEELKYELYSFSKVWEKKEFNLLE